MSPRGRRQPAERGDRVVLTVCLLVFVALSAVHVARRAYPDTVFLGGDTWEYQSMGVNISMGHGPRIGAIEPFETYRFEPAGPDAHLKATLIRLGAEGGDYNFFRTPGYPYFLGAIYTVVGVRPSVVMRVQALLWILVGSCLPYLGWRLWRWPGFLGGLIAGPAYLQATRGVPDEILTETLIVFVVFVTTLAHLRWTRTQSTGSLVLLGLSVGLALLVKGSLVFVPLLYLGHLAWSSRGGGPGLAVRRAATFACTVTIAVAPYSVFASIMDGRVVLLSTQGPRLLLEGNNELAVRTGGWVPRGDQRPESFHMRPDVQPLSPWVKVIRFYQADPSALLEILPRKIRQGFGSFDYLRLMCWMLISASALELLTGAPSLAGRPVLATTIAAAVAVGAGTAVQVVHVEVDRLLLATALVWLPAAWRRPRLRRLLPGPVLVYLVNFLLVTLITFGHRRFTGVMDFLVVLTAMTGTVWLCAEAARALTGRASVRGLRVRSG